MHSNYHIFGCLPKHSSVRSHHEMCWFAFLRQCEGPGLGSGPGSHPARHPTPPAMDEIILTTFFAVMQTAAAPVAPMLAPAASAQPPSPQRRRVHGCSPQEAAAAAAAAAARALDPGEDGSTQVDDAVMAQLMGMGPSAQKACKVTSGLAAYCYGWTVQRCGCPLACLNWPHAPS